VHERRPTLRTLADGGVIPIAKIMRAGPLEMSPVLIYRDRILPRSELNFMRRQYLGFQKLRPIWVGRHIEPSLDTTRFSLGPFLGGGLRAAAFKELGVVPRFEELRALKAVCVHAQFGRGGALALPLAEKLGLPLCVTFHGGEFKSAHYRRFPPALFRRRLERLKHYASRFICVSSGVRDRLIDRGFAPNRTVVVPIGVELQPPRPPNELGRGIYFVGRLVEMKGATLFVEAARRLRSLGYDEPIVLIGDGPDAARVTSAAAGIANVKFCGWLTPTEVEGALRGARMVCIPSIRARSGEVEGLPSIAVEAMALGAPVVASTEAGIEGLIEDGVSGKLFRSRDVSALAEAIRELLDDAAKCRAMASAARRKVEQDYDALAQSRQLEAVLFEATAGSGAGALS